MTQTEPECETQALGERNLQESILGCTSGVNLISELRGTTKRTWQLLK